MAASTGCSLFPGGFLFQNHSPRFRGAPSGFFKDCPQSRLSVDSGLGGRGPIGRARRLVSAQYDRRHLDELLSQRLGDKTLRGSKYRLLIPSTEGRNGEVYVFKTPHHPGYTLDGDELLLRHVALVSLRP